MMEGTNNSLLKVDSLVKHFPITRGVFRRQVGTVKAVDGVSIEIKKNGPYQMNTEYNLHQTL